MEVCAREAHIFHMGRSVQLVKAVRKLLGVARLNPTLTAIKKEVFQPLMRKTGDHGVSVTDGVTLRNGLPTTTARLLSPPATPRGRRHAPRFATRVSPSPARRQWPAPDPPYESGQW